MKKHRNILIRVFAILAVCVFLVITVIPGSTSGSQIPIIGLKTSPRNVPNADGFIQRWLILEPIAVNGDTQNAVQAAVKTEHFPNELTVIPHDGEKVTVNNAELTWHAVDTNEYNVNLYYFASEVGTNCNNTLFWAVVVVNCPQEIKDVRLAVGSNSASVWWVNGREVIGIYGDRQCVVDDGISKRLTLKKGPNVIRGGIVNRSGAADFCARFLGSDDKPLRDFTVSLSEDGK
jgi:hypothetical protein